MASYFSLPLEASGGVLASKRPVLRFVLAFVFYFGKNQKRNRKIHEKNTYTSSVTIAGRIFCSIQQSPFRANDPWKYGFLTCRNETLEHVTLGGMGLNRGSDIDDDLESIVRVGLGVFGFAGSGWQRGVVTIFFLVVDSNY